MNNEKKMICVAGGRSLFVVHMATYYFSFIIVRFTEIKPLVRSGEKNIKKIKCCQNEVKTPPVFCILDVYFTLLQ